MFSSPWFDVGLRVLATLWLVAVSIWDRWQQRIPNWLVLPVMGVCFVWQVYVSINRDAKAIIFLAVAWVVLYMMWRAHIFGGGDTKMLMALFALFPTVDFLALFSLVVCVVSIPLLITKYARVGPLEALRGIGRRLREGRLLPRAAELRTEGRPQCWTFALPGVIYLWLTA